MKKVKIILTVTDKGIKIDVGKKVIPIFYVIKILGSAISSLATQGHNQEKREVKNER